MVESVSAIRVLVVEPNAPLRAAILAVLDGPPFVVETCESLEQVLLCTSDELDTVAVVAWQAMNGLLADEHRHHLVRLANRVRLVVMVPRRWSRLLGATDLGGVVAGIVAKPFEADELMAAIRAAGRRQSQAVL